jgi:hypothetical protein
MPDIPYEFKLEIARRLCELSDEQRVEVLDALINTGWDEFITIITDQVKTLLDSGRDEFFALAMGLTQLPTDDRRFATWFTPFIQRSQIDCKLPKNEHVKVVHKKYKCSNANDTHFFCLDHNLTNMKCPIDDTRVSIV